jgi:Barrel-sandwich domain of CusB or HlyD membrane-fusion
MEPESDHSNSHQPSTASVASDERIHALIAEKEQLAADLPQAKSAIEASVCDVAATERLKRWQIPEREIARLKKSGKVSREIEIDSSVSGVVIERKAFPNMHVEPSTKLYAVAPDDAQAHQGEERTPLRRRRSPDLASERRRRLRGDAQPEPMIKFAEHITRCDAVVSTASDPDFAGFAPNRGAGASSVVSGMVD